MHRTRTETKPAPMVVDRQARTLMANALLGFMQGRLYSRAFEDALIHAAGFEWLDKFTADSSVLEFGNVFYSLYDDFRDEPIHVNQEEREALCRVWVFLQTDLRFTLASDFRWDRVKEYWPFASLEEWQAHQHLLPGELPEYDPALVPPRPPRPSELRVWAPIILVVGPAFIVTLLWILFLCGWLRLH